MYLSLLKCLNKNYFEINSDWCDIFDRTKNSTICCYWQNYLLNLNDLDEFFNLTSIIYKNEDIKVLKDKKGQDIIINAGAEVLT